jgi:hypothetical protein
MPAKKQPTQEFIDDVGAPTQVIRVLGRQLRLNAAMYATDCARRWTRLPEDEKQLREAGNAEGVNDVIFQLFADVVLPANSEWDAERLRDAFPWPVQVSVLRHFFTWAPLALRDEIRIEIVGSTVPVSSQGNSGQPNRAQRRAASRSAA